MRIENSNTVKRARGSAWLERQAHNLSVRGETCWSRVQIPSGPPTFGFETTNLICFQTKILMYDCPRARNKSPEGVDNMKKCHCILHFKEIETDEECNQLREILGILDIKYTVERKKEIEDHITYISKTGGPSNRSLPLDFYDFALQAYVFGFDAATIFYCCSAVEIMLAFLLGEKRDLKKMVAEAHSENLLDHEHYEIANKLRLLRNYYVHYVNHAKHFNELHQKAIDLADVYIKNPKKRERVLRILNRFHVEQTKLKFMGMHWGRITSQELKRFLDTRDEEYQKWLGEHNFGIRELRKFDFPKMRHFSRYRFDAVSAINWASIILQKLENT